MVKGRNILNILSFKHITGSTWRDVGREKRGGGGGRVSPPQGESVWLSQRLQLLEIKFEHQKVAQRLWMFLVAFYVWDMCVIWMRYMMLDIRCVNTCPGLLRADYSSPVQADQGKVREEAKIVRGTVRIIIVSYYVQLPSSSVIIIQRLPVKLEQYQTRSVISSSESQKRIIMET